jgi:hypothetical protein
MAHPDHDQVIGRIAGARLRGMADGRAVTGAAPEVHPDAETWAAYVDGGLQPDEVMRLETHLGGCGTCRRLVAVLTPEVTASTAPAVHLAEAPIPGSGVVIPFPRRQVFAWMAAAAGLFMAVTLWSVSRLGGNAPVARVAETVAPAGAPAPPRVPTAAAADDAARAARSSRIEDRKAIARGAEAPATAGGSAAAPLEQDKAKPEARSDTLAARQPAEFAAAEAKQRADVPAAMPAGNGRDIQLQTNTAAGGARPRGPLPNQQANQQAGTQQTSSQQYAQAPSAVAPASPPASAPAAAPAAPPAPAKAAAADTLGRRANEEPPGAAETVTITSGASARQAPAAPERRNAVGADREQQARLKDEAARPAALGYAAAAGSVSAPAAFAEPGGRLLWRIADGRRLESSSDGGATWKPRYTVRGDRLRTGTAPAIDSAWAVGERGLVLRFAVPGEWTAVSRAGTATLTGVTATGSQAARVTADDGRVFETSDGGATWTPARGADPR